MLDAGFISGFSRSVSVLNFQAETAACCCRGSGDFKCGNLDSLEPGELSHKTSMPFSDGMHLLLPAIGCAESLRLGRI